MLSSETKKKINNARDILVWTVPVPSEQINLITIALIYKFMSDIDLQNKEFWAEGFFVDEYEKYSRSNIMDRKIGAHDRLYLYSEWLDKMGTNPHLPQMFRDIFRNAFLPFKDPRILDMFLKQINEFSYDHSEELGNAFEYLLSTMASQWDSWMFRTPRHIIDFIIKVVEPKFTDTILDPACGSAWFLISAYKYILESNTEKKVWDKLSLAQKTELTKNFVGYDISHEMVRLSLVNMYLHNFWDPKIFEYDTLTSENRRDDRFDCILANPPFMTPKWGIQPHNKFSVKANRSEVLFVDYIMDHLNPQWKAWIVVPEWIIFQQGNAYKSLRKKMIEENYLRAVISLPSGVFQPYSWVKTSVLLFDKELAKKTDQIVFAQVNNDGYDLGAQRREISDNDLPHILDKLLTIKSHLKDWKILDPESELFVDEPLLRVTDKSAIAEWGDYNLSGKKYQQTVDVYQGSWPMVELGEVCEIVKEKPWEFDWEKKYYSTWSIKNWNNYDGFEYININNKPSRADILPKINDVWFAKMKNTCKNIIIDENFEWSIFSTWFAFLRWNERIIPKYLFNLIKSQFFQKTKDDLAVDWIMWWIRQSDILAIKIPLPPLAVQEQIVAELEWYQQIIDGARQIVDNRKPSITIDPDWEMVKLGEVAEVISWQSPRSEFYNKTWEWLPFFQWKTLFTDRFIWQPDTRTTEITKESLKGDILMSVRAPVWPVNINNFEKICIWRWLCAIRKNGKILLEYLFSYLLWIQETIRWNWWAVFDSISRWDVEKIKIPLPPLDIQKQIVAHIEHEQSLVDSASSLISLYEQKIQDKIQKVWEG